MARWCTTARQLLELFYDLTYVVLISRATHHLVSHVEWRGVGEFAVVFALVWLA